MVRPNKDFGDWHTSRTWDRATKCIPGCIVSGTDPSECYFETYFGSILQNCNLKSGWFVREEEVAPPMQPRD